MSEVRDMGVLYNPVVLRACFMHLFFGLDILSMINENAFLQVPLGGHAKTVSRVSSRAIKMIRELMHVKMSYIL